jgi:hypothetical protein
MNHKAKIEAFKKGSVYGTGKGLKPHLVVAQKFNKDPETGKFTVPAKDEDGDPVLMPVPKKHIRQYEAQGYREFVEQKSKAPTTKESKAPTA